MNTIFFMAVTEPTDKPKHVVIGKRFSKYAGKYEVREISAQEGIEAIDILIAGKRELQENPEQLEPSQLRKAQIEKATTLNGKPLVIEDLDEFPNKLWQILVGANQMLNGVSIEEARFLLQPSGAEPKQSIQQ